MLTFPPDFSFIVQIISFLLLWAALKRLTFDPVMRVLEQREERTRGGLAEAEHCRAAARSAEAEYEQSLRQVRQSVSQEADAARKEAAAEQQRQMAAARAAADEELTRMRREIATQVEEARKSLSEEARSIATQMAERVSGRSLA